MTTMTVFAANQIEELSELGRERRKHRRHDLEPQTIVVNKFDGHGGIDFGQVVDMSSGGICIRTRQANIRPDQQIRVRVQLPTYAGISPFVDISSGAARPKTEWIGWM